MFSYNTPGQAVASRNPPGSRGPGRPRGPSLKSAATSRRLYETAIRLFADDGYQRTTLRAIARRADVSPGLLYRYFPSKRAVVLALYDELSAVFADRTQGLPAGSWRKRFGTALRASLEVLGPHRDTLRALVPLLVSTSDEGLFAASTATSRARVEGAFVRAVTGAKDAPRGATGAALGRVLYLVHLGAILWWLLDRSRGQSVTRKLIGLMERSLAPFALALRVPRVRGFVRELDGLVASGLLARA